MMHLTETEWDVLSFTLNDPEHLANAMPLINRIEIEAKCEDLFHSREYNERNMLEFKILEACINHSTLLDDMPYADCTYDHTRSLIDAAYSLQDRFAARFAVPPRDWFKLMGSKVERPKSAH